MNIRPKIAKPASPSALADEPDFTLSRLTISPSRLEIAFDERTEAVQPRVMQVLVALTRANGAVVSRDELIRQCWGGQIVGDDAINRSIAKVRALADLAGEPAFEIETVPRVGYRMISNPSGTIEFTDVNATPPGTLEKMRRSSGLTKPDNQSNVDLEQRAAKELPLKWWLFAAAMTCALVAALSIHFFANQKRSSQWSVKDTHFRFVSTPLIERYPTFSPDGAMIAYSAGADVFSRNIYLRRLTGSDSLQLTIGSSDAIYPAWSPDGNSIAYIEDYLDKPCNIMLVSVPAGPLRQIARCMTTARTKLSWGRDSQNLFYVDSLRSGQPPSVVKLDVQSGKIVEVVRPVRNRALNSDSISVSPDGRELAFLRDDDLVLHDLANSSDRTLFISAEDFDNVAWSFDSRDILMTRNTPWSSSLWSYPVDGGEPQRVLVSPTPITRPATGPYGLVALELDNHDLELMSASVVSGRPPEPLDTLGLTVVSLDYAPDGTLGVISQQPNGADIWVKEPGASFHKLLPLGTTDAGCLRFSPDDAQVAYIKSGTRGAGVAVIDRRGSVKREIILQADEISSIAWNADSKSLLVTSRDAKGWRIWNLDIANSNRVTPISDYGWNLVRTSGGAVFAVRDGVDGVWQFSARPRRLTELPTARFSRLWTVASGHVYFPDYADPAHPLFIALNITTGKRVIAGYDSHLWPGSEIGVDPKTLRVGFVSIIRDDADIGWLRLIKTWGNASLP